MEESRPLKPEEENTAASTEPQTEQVTLEKPLEEAAEEAVQPTAARRRGGWVVPVFLGGVLVAVIGFTGVRYLAPESWPGAGSQDIAALEEQLAGQAARIAALDARIAALPAPQDSAGLAERLEGLAREFAESATRDELWATALAGVQTRLAALEARDAAPLSTPERAALEHETQALREMLETRFAQLAEDASQRAAAADTQARQAAIGAALAHIRAALEAGTPYASALDALAGHGVALPEGIGAGVQPVPTLAQLQARFPDAARAALAESRRAVSGDTLTARLGAFLRSQFGLRSLSPRAGDDADAVLSRAEAALRAGDLAGVLAEIAALPAPAQGALAEWRAAAQARLAAVDALNTVSIAQSAD